MSRASSRRGYAMVIVVIFIVLVNLFFVLGWKHISMAIRVQDTFQNAKQRDEGALLALATAVAQMQTEYPTKDTLTNTYCYGVMVDSQQFKVIYTPPDPFDPDTTDTHNWSIAVQVQDPTNVDLRDLYTEYPD